MPSWPCAVSVRPNITSLRHSQEPIIADEVFSTHNSPISRGLIQSLRAQSISVTPYKPETDKRARVISQSDLLAAGSIRFPQRAGWLEDLTAELLAFPGRHDDQIDGASYKSWPSIRPKLTYVLRSLFSG